MRVIVRTKDGEAQEFLDELLDQEVQDYDPQQAIATLQQQLPDAQTILLRIK